MYPSPPRARAFAELITEFARVLEIQVIAEGIEAEAHRDILAGMGCKYGQGCLLAMPMQWRESGQVALRDLECRPYHQDLIYEGTKK